MLEFSSASARIVNTVRAVQECVEVALGTDKADLLIFHASMGHPLDTISETAMTLVPGARVVAASCCGVVGREGVSESMKDIALMAVKGSEFCIAHTNGVFGHNAYDKCRDMARSLRNDGRPVNMVYFMASGIDIANDRCIAAIEAELGHEVTIFGATSSDNMKGVISFQAADGELYEHGAFMIGFCDESLSIYTQATHGFVAIGEPMIVTKAEGNKIIELDGKPAWEEYTSRLGLATGATCGDTIPTGALAELLPANLAAEYGNKHILRVVTSREDNTMCYATECKPGTRLWLTFRDEEKIFSEMDRLVHNLLANMGDKTPVAVFHADCLARGRYLMNRIMKEELVGRMQTPFYNNGECPPWLGMYGFGEFARLGGVNTFHNYTTALYVICRG